MTGLPATKRILVLDDDVFMLKLLNQMLQGMGYSQVVTSDNGYAALEYINSPEQNPDLILLDLNMPDMDGIEFVRHLVERQYSGSLILISGEDERMLQTAVKLMQAHNIQVLGHLHKPAKPDELKKLLSKWAPPKEHRARPDGKEYSASEVRAAIIHDELVNYYQPKVEIATGQVVGVETLVRWKHPVDGMVFPNQFVSVAEANGLIDDLTRAVLTNALAQTRIWLDMGLQMRVAVNVSMDNLTSLDFADYVDKKAKLAGVPPQHLVLEVTESRLMNDLRVPLEILTRLRLKRFRLSIDDFGTGNSSLAQLRDIPFDELKIDQSFVHGAGRNETLRAMFDASFNLARQLNMDVVAEGVEDREDWDFLRSSGCDTAQGYFIAKPMPADDFSGWLKTWPNTEAS